MSRNNNKESKQQRLSGQLRANLNRRKHQKRMRQGTHVSNFRTLSLIKFSKIN